MQISERRMQNRKLRSGFRRSLYDYFAFCILRFAFSKHQFNRLAALGKQTAALLRVRQEMRRFSFAVGRYQALRRRRVASIMRAANPSVAEAGSGM